MTGVSLMQRRNYPVPLVHSDCGTFYPALEASYPSLLLGFCLNLGLCLQNPLLFRSRSSNLRFGRFSVGARPNSWESSHAHSSWWRPYGRKPLSVDGAEHRVNELGLVLPKHTCWRIMARAAVSRETFRSVTAPRRLWPPADWPGDRARRRSRVAIEWLRDRRFQRE